MQEIQLGDMFKKYKAEIEEQRNTPQNSDLTAKTDPDSNKTQDKPEKLRRQKTGSKDGDKNWEPLKRHRSSWNKDVMISYSHANKDFMMKIKGLVLMLFFVLLVPNGYPDGLNPQILATKTIA